MANSTPFTRSGIRPNPDRETGSGDCVLFTVSFFPEWNPGGSLFCLFPGRPDRSIVPDGGRLVFGTFGRDSTLANATVDPSSGQWEENLLRENI